MRPTYLNSRLYGGCAGLLHDDSDKRKMELEHKK